MAQLRGTEHDSHFRLLSIFAHGTLDDYEGPNEHSMPLGVQIRDARRLTGHTAAKSELPALTDAASKKLRMLTVASMAAAKKVGPGDGRCVTLLSRRPRFPPHRTMPRHADDPLQRAAGGAAHLEHARA